LLGLDGLVLGLHMADRASEPDHLARDCIAQQREVSSLPVSVALEQPRARTEIDAEQLAELAARPRRKQSGHLVLDISRERNKAPPGKRDASPRPQSIQCWRRLGSGLDGRDAHDRGRPRRHTEEMERDERVLVMGEDVGRKGGVFGATDGLYARFGEARVLDTPLAESAIIGVAIGAALNGMVPIAEIQFADFIHAAFDQIVSEAARTRYRSNGDW